MVSKSRYRIFARDVGGRGYSAATDVMARTAREAVAWADLRWPDWSGKHIARSHNAKHLWPDRKTGLLPKRVRNV
jgi:hypothetical protein